MRSTTHSSPGLSAQQLWLRDAELLLASEAEAEGEGEATPSPPPEDRRKLARRRPGVAARRPGLALKIGRRTKSESTELTGHGRHGRHAMILAETYELVVELTRENDELGIVVTYGDESRRCNTVMIEPAAGRLSDLHYGDQIVSVDGSSLAGRNIKYVIVPKPTHRLVVRYTRTSSQAVSPRRVRARKVYSQGGGV